MATTANFGLPVPDSPDPAKVPEHMLNLAVPIDALLRELSDRVEAREKVFVRHQGDGKYSFSNGLGEPIPASHLGDGSWQIIP